MITLRLARLSEIQIAVDIIDAARRYMKEEKINQWQSGYPDYACIEEDIKSEKGFFVVEREEILGYLCADFDGEPAYDAIQGAWHTSGDYVVVHRMAFAERGRGKKISSTVFRLIEELSRQRGVTAFRIDTDASNKTMLHILKKNGFTFCGTIHYSRGQRMAFDKVF